MIDLCVDKHLKNLKRLNIIEQEQAKYIVKEANEEEAITKFNENTEKESKENNVLEGKLSKEANILENEPVNIEADETSSNADATDQEHEKSTSNTKESINIKCLELKCQQCSFECMNNVTRQKLCNTKNAVVATGTKDDSI